MHRQIANLSIVLIVLLTATMVMPVVQSAPSPHRPPPHRPPPHRPPPHRPPPNRTPPRPSAVAKRAAPQIWCLFPGRTLRSTLDSWATTAGWRLHWQSRYDYPIAVTVCLKGAFLQVLPGIAHSYRHANHPFYLDLYPKQRLAMISDS